MKIGVYYYPEQWPRQQWERDFDNMVSMGLQIVHMGEFAWHSLEPRPGEFQFDWLADCVELAAARKLGVILCTPTAAPPIWLAQDHPETLPVDAHGTPARFGGRRHYNPTSRALHEAAVRIVTALAERFAPHPAVIGWQIDNEYSGEFDQSDSTHSAFRAWLERKYGTIDGLNAAWGNQFWNTYYSSFDQILMPRSRDPGYANPHHALDASRFWSFAFASFNKLQADILKPRIGDRFITTNFMPFHLDCDPGDFAGDLSVFSWDAYPVTGWVADPTDDTYRMADPARMGFYHDLMASYTGRWALLELQTGQVNWSGVPVLLYPGVVRLWLWSAIAHGAEFITTYRYRQSRFGIELFHHGLVGPDGVTPSAGGRQFIQVIDELQRLQLPRPPISVAEAAVVETVPPEPAKPSRRRISRRGSPVPPTESQPMRLSKSIEAKAGLLFDFDQLWWFETLPQAKRWDQRQWIASWYAALMRLSLHVEVLHPTHPWPTDLSVIVAPGVQMVDDALVKTFDDYASGGGSLILTCRTALMDRNGQLFEGPLAKPILPLIGASIEAYDGLPADTWGSVEMDGVQHRWGAWGDLLYTEESTRALGRYSGSFYAGAAAVTQRRHGAGTVTYCGVFAEQSLCDAVVEKVAVGARLPTTVLPPRVHVVRRGPHRILLNYQDKPVEAPAPRTARFVVGARKVEPAGVAVWEE
jgi:beta-galactosidase